MDDVSKKREALIAAYSGDKWRKKVLAMSDTQVIAVFMRLRKQDKV